MAIKAHLDPAADSAPATNASATDDSQRSAPRRALRLEASGLAPDGDEANVTIHNISAAGLLIETALNLAQGEQLALDLPEAGVVTAVIVWRSNHLYGCAFKRALGPAALAAAQLQGAAPTPTGPTDVLNTRSIEPLGTRLNRLRREAGLTLADVAGALGVSKPTVWAWEKGKARPLPERMDAIAATLGIAIEDLAENHGASDAAGAVIEECRNRIAAACGIQPKSLKILIEL